MKPQVLGSRLVVLCSPRTWVGAFPLPVQDIRNIYRVFLKAEALHISSKPRATGALWLDRGARRGVRLRVLALIRFCHDTGCRSQPRHGRAVLELCRWRVPEEIELPTVRVGIRVARVVLLLVLLVVEGDHHDWIHTGHPVMELCNGESQLVFSYLLPRL